MTGGRLLVALGALFVTAFVFQRLHSPFLRIEREADLAASLAGKSGLKVEEVMALRESCGVDVEGEALANLVRTFATDRARLGDELAAVAAAGERPLAERLFREAGGDLARAHEALRPLPQAILAVRYLAMRERFAERRR